jgi:hypothetical protein
MGTKLGDFAQQVLDLNKKSASKIKLDAAF